ncbi:TPA: replication-relaxation family protein [Enterococcus faecium]
MNHLLYNYFIKMERSNLDIMILALLHELRVATAVQIHSFINTELTVPLKTIRNHLKYLSNEQELISFFYSSKDSKTKIYYLDRLGYYSIQGYYPLPKVPEYNWYHSLMINDTMLSVLQVVNEHKNLRYMQSERRQVYEIKDTEKNQNGRVFFVSDYLLRFNSEGGKEINWYFEIELTIKTKKRYKNHVFVRYINYLATHDEAKLIYVTPSATIHEELEKYKWEVERKIKDKQKANEIFSRFHILSLRNFQSNLEHLIETDTYINW